MINEGDYVQTTKGARFQGEVVSLFETRNGKLRAVVEATDEKFAETLHVYPLEQLIVVPAP